MTRLNPASATRSASCYFILAMIGWLLSPAVIAAERMILNFNPDWKFTKSDPSGAEQITFDDHAWSNVSTPHTFNDVDTFDNWSTPGHRGEQIQWAGRTWYRKTFTTGKAWNGKRVFIEFEGIRQIGEVYLNGEKLGVAKTGFTPFGFDLTPHLKFGAPNVLAVMVDNRFMKDPLDPATLAEIAQRSGTDPTAGKLSSTANINLGEHSKLVNDAIPENLDDLQADQIPWNNPHWHPAHGGIYRNVRLIVTDALHISLPLYSFLATAGPYAYATTITEQSATVGVEIPVQNQRATAENVELRTEIFDSAGRSALVLKSSEGIAAGASFVFKLSGPVTNPRLWEPAYPYLYRVVTTLRVNNQIIDSSEIPLGIRTVRWDASAGFFINGQHLKLHGWGQKPTDEWPGLGAALPDWLHYYTLQMMKDAGGNFLRWGHSAAGPAQIDAGDRLGLITLQPGVDGESDTVRSAWKLRSMAFRDMIIYFRNHPSILIWEGGNQKVTHDHAKELRGWMDQWDPHGGRAYAHRRADQITAEFMDVGVGTEGQREIASLPVVEGEYDREESPRRVWDNASPPNFGYPEAKGMLYQLTSEQYAINQIGPQYLKKLGAEWNSGGANWIFSDSTSGGRVPAEVDRAGGEVDGVRLAKEAYYVCAVMFRDDPQVHIIGHWTYPAGTKKTVYVASNGDDVELFLNGTSIGHGQRSDKYLFTFPEVSWAQGTLKAVSTRGGITIATHEIKTAGPAVGLKLTTHVSPDGLRADGSDILLVDVEAVDASGVRCPTFQERVDFETEGPAIWRGGYNSGKINSINVPYLDLEAGINRVALRTTRIAGKITVRAKREGLKTGSVFAISREFPADGGYTSAPMSIVTAHVPAQMPTHPGMSAVSALANSAAAKTKVPVQAGKFIKAFGYTGPNANIVHVEVNAQNGKTPYSDRDQVFARLPPSLLGADWIQVADADAKYNAVDLVELAVADRTVVSIAHDDRATLPAWLTQQFQATTHTVKIAGQTLRVFERKMDQAGSLTLGSNSDAGNPASALMYLVFVNGAAK